MDQADMKRLHEEAALWQWADKCGDASDRQLPRLILDSCQAVYDLAFGAVPPIPQKRAVFEAVAAGTLDAAVQAIAPSCRVALTAGEHGTVARADRPDLGLSATAKALHPVAAQLRSLLELVLTAKPNQRAIALR